MKNLLRILAVVAIISIAPSCAQDDMNEIQTSIQDESFTDGDGKDGEIEKPGGN